MSECEYWRLCHLVSADGLMAVFSTKLGIQMDSTFLQRDLHLCFVVPDGQYGEEETARYAIHYHARATDHFWPAQFFSSIVDRVMAVAQLA